MSVEHARRLKSVRREREATEEALEKSWRYGSSRPQYDRCDVDDIRLAFLNVEKTYTIRLIAEADALFNIGATLADLSQFGKAIENYRRALVIYRHRGDKAGEVRALNAIAQATEDLAKNPKGN